MFDGDHKDHSGYSGYFENPNEDVDFLYPFDAPEKFLIRAYLAQNPNPDLAATLQHSEHHALFQQMANLGLAADAADARSIAFTAFEGSVEYAKHYEDLSAFLMRIATKYSSAQE